MATSKTIKIKSRAHSGMNNAGIHVEAEYHLGPKNLLKAIKDRKEISESNERSWGSIGHQGTWIEIDGVKISREKFPLNMIQAKELISSVLERNHKCNI